jgi:hypothetical protein
MAFTPDDRHRDLGQVIREAGGPENFSRLINLGKGTGASSSTPGARSARRRPVPPSKRLPNRWRAHPEPR